MVKMISTFWDKRSKRYDADIIKHGAAYEETIKSTLELVTDSDVVLDFACATGEHSLGIAPHVRSVHGIDTSAKMIELAK